MSQEQKGPQYMAVGRAASAQSHDAASSSVSGRPHKHPRHRDRANGTIDDASDVENELDRLFRLSVGALRVAWKRRFGGDALPIRSRSVLLRLMAWKIQADLFGELDAKTERRLNSIADALERDGTYQPKLRRDLSLGLELTREWKGTVHKITVTTDGFQYLGKHYASLSDIARTITGTRWSGPRFFGLEQRAERVATPSLAP